MFYRAQGLVFTEVHSNPYSQFNSVKIPAIFLDIDELILKFLWKQQKRKAKTILMKKKVVGRLALQY